MYMETSSEDAGRIQDEIRALESQIHRTQKAYQELADVLEEYNEIPEQSRPTEDGYSNSAARIRASRPIIDELREKFTMQTLDARLSSVDYDKKFNSHPKDISTIYSTLTIDFQSSDDVTAYAFIDDLINKMPGYLYLESLKMEHIDDISSPDFLRTLSELETEPALVVGKMEFSWRTLKKESRSDREKNQKSAKK